VVLFDPGLLHDPDEQVRERRVVRAVVDQMCSVAEAATGEEDGEVGVVAAESKGPGIFASIPLPGGRSPATTVSRPPRKRGRCSTWEGGKRRIRWERTSVLPGNHETTDAWFADKLTETAGTR
jgi:hypothetical protein